MTNPNDEKEKSLYEFSALTAAGKEVHMADFAGKVILVVNTASKCGLTPQYEGLEILYKKYKDKGLMILGFPCNQFADQEPGNDEEIQSFCKINYGVSFPIFSKIDVNGKNVHPLFKFLKSSLPGLLGSKIIKWNFTKFLINREGKPVKRFGPQEVPESFEKDIQALLAKD